MRVVIVGGSLAGLMNGIVLKHHGCDVDILEQRTERLEGQAAGVATGINVKRFLELHDRVKGNFAFPSNGVQEIGKNSEVLSELRFFNAMSTWDALYYRLRANFDGRKSSYCPNVPPQENCDGTAAYHHGKKLVSILSNDNQGGGDRSSEKALDVCYEDVLTGETHNMSADLVIGADGSNSSVRTLFSSKVTHRRYAGYVMWRGLVPERSLKPQTRETCSEWFSFCLQSPAVGYALIYPVPGKNGSMEAGKRDINLAWYSRISADELSEALTDIDGYKHQWSVPIGKLSPAIWQKQLMKESDSLNLFAKDLVSNVESPFLQVIGDFTAPQASFLGGKVLLVGDGLVTLRPHTGSGISSCAFHALQLEKELFENNSNADLSAAIQKWEKAVLEYSHMERLRSISWGEYYLGGWKGWLPAALHYHGLSKLREWQTWLFGLF